MSRLDRKDTLSIYVDSSKITSGTKTDFKVSLVTPYRRVRAIEVTGCEVPFAWYVFNSAHNTIKFLDNASTLHTATVPVGNYTGNTVITAIQTALNNSGVTGFVVSFDSVNLRLRITNTAAFNLQYASTTASKLIGLTADSGLVTDFTCQGVVNLSWPAYILITSTALMQLKVSKPVLGTTQSNILYRLAINGSPGDVIIDKNLYPRPILFQQNFTIDTFDIQLTDPDGNILDLNGADWSFTLAVDTL